MKKVVIIEVVCLLLALAAGAQEAPLQLVRLENNQFRATWPASMSQGDISVVYIWDVQENHRAQVSIEKPGNSHTFTCNSGCTVQARRVVYTAVQQRGPGAELEYRRLNYQDSETYYMEKTQPYYVRLRLGQWEKIYWPLEKTSTSIQGWK